MLVVWMRRWAVFCGAALLVACSSSPRQSEPEVEVPRQYMRAYVSDIAVTLLDTEADQARLSEKKGLEVRLPGVAREAVEYYEWKAEVKDPGPQPDLVRLKLTVKYDPGNRALRWLAGFAGAGKGTVLVQADAYDGASGALIASERAEDYRRMGAFGGTFDGVVEAAVGSAIYEVLSKLYEIPRRTP